MRYARFMIYLLISLLIPSSIANDVVVTVPALLKAAEVKYSLPSGILSALAHVESGSNHTIVTKEDGIDHKTSYGLLQIKLDTAKFVQSLKARRSPATAPSRNKITPNQLMNPEANIEYGAYYLKWLMQNNNNDIAHSLSCYNAGANSKICKEKLYSQYVGRILNAWISKRSE